MRPFVKGGYRARLAQTPAERARVLQMRQQIFRAARTVIPDAGVGDGDEFDGLCQHMLIEDAASGRLVCSFRFQIFCNGFAIDQGYAWRHYDLTALQAFAGRLIEIGRFCIDPDSKNPDILRLAWAALTRVVDGEGVGMMFGCSSLAGANPQLHLPTFAVLRASHLAPEIWAPGEKSLDIYRYAQELSAVVADPVAGWRAMPPLLRTYLSMGGWVSDHAVLDPSLDTLHVLTAVEIAAIPQVRARLLRGLAA